MDIRLLISPLAHGAYFDAYREVALAELAACLPGVVARHEQRGPLDFIAMEAETSQLPLLAQLSFVQGIFEVDGDRLAVVEQAPGFLLPSELVTGFKYQGKTNELVTQLALNVARAQVSTGRGEEIQLLDPLAGRGTTLLWGLRYGMNARGIERDTTALDAFHQHVRKQAKLHRLKHEIRRGNVGKTNRKGIGRYTEVHMAGHTARLIAGDSRDAGRWLQKRRFHLLVADLPYGVQHLSEGGGRDPGQMVADCAAGWVEHLRTGGAMVLIFNEYQPGRAHIAHIFGELGLVERPFAAPHRMSESIVRDLILFVRERDR